MKRFVEGEDRRQGILLPEFLEDYVSEENPVRVIDVFVEELDLGALGFEGVVPEATGRPAYHPGVLLKNPRLRLHQPDRLEPPAGAGGPAQPRADVADRTAGSRLQDHRRLQEGQRPGDRAPAAGSSICAGDWTCSLTP